MKITKKLKRMVVDEALSLRLACTKEEKDRLNYKQLDGSSQENCVYGMLTGYCSTPRAIELFSICAQPYSAFIQWYAKPTITMFNQGHKYNRSAIECYVYHQKDRSKIKDLINLIKS